jgi:hypothetical protein
LISYPFALEFDVEEPEEMIRALLPALLVAG